MPACLLLRQEDRAAAKAAEEGAAVAAARKKVKNTYALLRTGMAALYRLPDEDRPMSSLICDVRTGRASNTGVPPRA